jgi:DNA-binding transcriptional regulator YiaG
MNYQPPTPDDVRALRERHKLTQVQLAALACVTPRAAQMWEAATSTLSHNYPSESAWTLVLIRVNERGSGRIRRRGGK